MTAAEEIKIIENWLNSFKYLKLDNPLAEHSKGLRDCWNEMNDRLQAIKSYNNVRRELGELGLPQILEDDNNFTFVLDEREYIMTCGQLTVDDVEFEDNADDPTYSLVRAYWRMITNVK